MKDLYSSSGGVTIFFLLLFVVLFAVAYFGYDTYKVSDTADYELKLSAYSSSVTNEDDLPVTVTFTNNSKRQLNLTFPSGCTSPDVYVNGNYAAGERDSICTTALTDVNVPAGQSIAWNLVIPNDRLDQPINHLHAVWGPSDNYSSTSLQVVRVIRR